MSPEDVFIVIKPLEVAPEPLETETAPPYPVVASPPEREREPAEAALSPTTSATSPDRPLDDEPELRVTDPETPCVARPVASVKFPVETPEAEVTLIVPLSDDADPEDTTTSPPFPSAVEDVEFPARSDREPPLPSMLDPAVTLTEPLAPDADEPELISILPEAPAVESPV